MVDKPIDETIGLSELRSPFTSNNAEGRVTSINSGAVIKTDKEMTLIDKCAVGRKRDIEKDQTSEYDERL